jgi:hypothetical protein
MATTRKKVTAAPAAVAEATPEVPPPSGAPAAEPAAAGGVKSPEGTGKRGRRPTHDEAELDRIGREAVELYNQGAKTTEIFAALGIKRPVLKRAWGQLGVPMPKPGVRAPGSILTVPDHAPTQPQPSAQRSPRKSSSRPPAKAPAKKSPSPLTATDGSRVTVELPLEDLVRANRTAILRILLRDLEAQSS